MSVNDALIQYCLRLADDCLVLGHRVSEWSGHAPIIEEDIALSNIALDLIGQSINFYKYAAELDDTGKNEDDYAYFRDSMEFRNLLLVEQPNGDFAKTILRQFFFDSFTYFFYQELKDSNDKRLSELADKHIKEIRYHLRHSSEWVLRLGDGTEESHNRINSALNDLWRFTGEMFMMNEVDNLLNENGIAVNLNEVKPEWEHFVSGVLSKANLQIPTNNTYMHSGGRNGVHTEFLGHLLAEMQSLPRTHPGAKW